MPSKLPEMVTVEELARRWHLKPGTIRKWARRGMIPSRKAGRLILFDVRELEQWLEGLPARYSSDIMDDHAAGGEGDSDGIVQAR